MLVFLLEENVPFPKFADSVSEEDQYVEIQQKADPLYSGWITWLNTFYVELLIDAYLGDNKFETLPFKMWITFTKTDVQGVPSLKYPTAFDIVSGEYKEHI